MYLLFENNKKASPVFSSEKLNCGNIWKRHPASRPSAVVTVTEY